MLIRVFLIFFHLTGLLALLPRLRHRLPARRNLAFHLPAHPPTVTRYVPEDPRNPMTG